MFGPYLVIRTREPTQTPAEYLERAAQVMVVGKSLFIGDADINFVTVRRAADRLGRSTTSSALLELDDLAVAGRVLERCQAGGRAGGAVFGRRRRAAAIAAEAPTRPPSRNERARPRRSSSSMGR